MNSPTKNPAAYSMIRASAGALLLAASGRALSIRRYGQPHPTQLALMGLEFAIPALIVPWKRSVAREMRAGRGA